jgi:ribosomal subunit interface protein
MSFSAAPFRVSGKNLEVGEALRERVSARVHESLGKYFDGGWSGHVTIGKEGFGFHTECVVHLDSGVVLRADAMAADAYLSADQAADNLEKQLRRYHEKLKDYHANG